MATRDHLKPDRSVCLSNGPGRESPTYSPYRRPTLVSPPRLLKVSSISRKSDMHRRTFLTSSLVAPMLRTASATAQSSPAPTQKFVQLCHYTVAPGGAQTLDAYFRDALIPAANRQGVSPIGVFTSWFGPESLSGRYLLLPGDSLDTIARLDAVLAADDVYARAAAGFLDAAPAQSPFLRLETSLVQTMRRLPAFGVPAEFANSKTRLFELRTYVQPTLASHARKVAMFEEGEANILAKCGFTAVFHGINLIGSGFPGAGLPSLTYMWVYPNLAQRQAAEEAWGASEERRTFFALMKYANTPSTISNIILQPASYSQM